MDFFTIINEIAVLFIVIGIGFASGKIGLMSSKTTGEISSLLMKVTFPALIISTMDQQFSAELFKNSIGIVVISVVVHGLFILAAYLWSKLFDLPHEKMSVLRFVIIFGNVTFVGFPLIDVIYGRTGLFFAASFNFLSLLILFSYGILLLATENSGNIFKKMLNPGLMSVLIGYILFLTPLELPYIVGKTLQWIGDITIPLALVVVGNSLSGIPFKEMLNEKQLWYVSLVRLVVLPVMLLFALRILKINPFLTGISVILAGTPGPLLAGIFARTYGCDGNLGDRSIFLTHLLSILTIPLLILLLGI